MALKWLVVPVTSFLFAVVMPLQGMDLLEAYDTAYKNSPLIKSQYAAYQSQNIDQDIVLGQLLPSLSVSGQVNQAHISGDSRFAGGITSINYGVNLSQSIFDYALINIYRSTAETSQASYATYQYQVQQFMLKVADAYFSVLLAQKNVEVAKEQVKATKATLEQTKAQQKAGTKTISDIKQVESRFYEATATLVKNKNAYKANYYKLAELTGVNEIEALKPLKADLQVRQPDPANMEEWVDKALQKNLNLTSSRHHQVAKEMAVEACKGKFLPSVSLSASYIQLHDPFFQPGFGSGPTSSAGALASLLSVDVDTSCLTSTSNQISPGSGGTAGIPLKGLDLKIASVGVTFTWQVLNGGTDAAALRSGAEDYVESRYATLQNQRSIRQQTEQDYLSVLSAISTIRASRQAKTASDVSYNSMLDQYEAGTTTINEVLQQLQITYKNAYQVAQAEFDYITSHFQLKLDAGELSREDLRKVNRLLQQHQ